MKNAFFNGVAGSLPFCWVVYTLLSGCAASGVAKSLPHEPRGAKALVSPGMSDWNDAEGAATQQTVQQQLEPAPEQTDAETAAVGAHCDLSAPLPSDITPGLSVDSLHQLGQAKIESKQSQDAVSILREAASMAPENPLVKADLATAMLQCGMISNGVETMEAATMLAPENADIVANLAQAYQMAGRFRAARIVYEKAVALSPSDSSIRNNLAVVLVALGDGEEAEHQIRKAIALNPEETAYLVDLGYILVRQNRLQDAEIVLERAVKKDADSAGAFNMLGFVYFQLQHRQRAKENFIKALTIDPEHRAAQENLQALEAELEPDPE